MDKEQTRECLQEITTPSSSTCEISTISSSLEILGKIPCMI